MDLLELPLGEDCLELLAVLGRDGLRGLSDGSSRGSNDLETSLDTGSVVDRFEEVADLPEELPLLTGSLEVALDSESLVELDSLLRDDRGSTPDTSRGTESHCGEGQGVPAVEQGDAALLNGLSEHVDLLLCVARCVLEVVKALDLTELTDLSGGEVDSGCTWQVVVHDRDLDGRADGSQELLEGLEAQRVVEWWDNHAASSANRLVVLGESNGTLGGQGAEAGNDWNAAGSSLDVSLNDGLVLLIAEGSELSGSTGSDNAVDASVNETVDLLLDVSNVDLLAIGSEGSGDSRKDTSELDHCVCG